MSAEHIGEQLGDLLLRDGLVSSDTLDAALRQQRDTGRPLTTILVEMEAITEQVKLNFLQRRLGHDIVSLRDHQVPDILYTYYPKSLAHRLRAVPYKLEGSALAVAFEDPSDIEAVDRLEARVGMKIRAVCAPSADIDLGLERYPGPDPNEEGDEYIHYEPSMLAKIIKMTFFPLFAFMPLVTVIFLLIFHDQFQNHMSHPPMGLSPKEAIFSMVLIWGIWSLLIYELDGIFVNPEHRE